MLRSDEAQLYENLSRFTGERNSAADSLKLVKRTFLMAYTHIAHDCITGKKVIFANNATLAGHIVVGDNATIGGLVAIHQFVRIGDYAYVGGKSAVVKDIPPYVIASGDRAKLHGLNSVGLKRHGFSQETLSSLKKAYRIIFRIGITLNEAIERVRAEVEQIREVGQPDRFYKIFPARDYQMTHNK